MNRRAFLGRVIAIVSAFLLARPSKAAKAVGVETKLANLFHDPAAARAIGEAYLARTPPGIDASTLLSSLSKRLGPAFHREPQTPEEVRDLVGKQVRLDFAEGDCLRLDGWVLSKTEVELCALAALRL